MRVCRDDEGWCTWVGGPDYVRGGRLQVFTNVAHNRSLMLLSSHAFLCAPPPTLHNRSQQQGNLMLLTPSHAFP
jgi:hypothetical protein